MNTIEWDIETMDENGDILDHEHSDDCPVRELDGNECLVLVRDQFTPRLKRSWAYVTQSGELPEWFTGSDGENVARVPKRFRDELKKVR